MKHPTPSDFIVNVEEGNVSVIFKPSDSYYSFGRLADPRGHCASWPPVAITECETRKNWRHWRLSIGRGRTDGAFVGSQGNYDPVAVREMLHPPRAYPLPCKVSEQPVGTGLSYIGVQPTTSGSNLMPEHPINDPKHWLDRAKEARAL